MIYFQKKPIKTGRNMTSEIVKKKEINERSVIPMFSEGEIWWCNTGKNIGVEINGKHGDFSRPVYIYKKLSANSIMVIPLTSQKKREGDWYVHFVHRDFHEYAAVCHAKVISSKRLFRRLGMTSRENRKKIEDGFSKLYIKNDPNLND